jgi:hypothetical protein
MNKSHGMNLILSLLFGPLGAWYLGFAEMLLSVFLTVFLHLGTELDALAVYSITVVINVLFTFEYNRKVRSFK